MKFKTEDGKEMVKVFSKKVAEKLIKLGHSYYIEPNKKKEGFNVWVFENDEKMQTDFGVAVGRADE